MVIGEGALRIVTQVSAENRAKAEKEAIEEIAGYLRPKYDCQAIFSADGDNRNQLVVMYTCDIALYHMAASLPQNMGMQIREKRYERALDWLKGVQAEKILPDLPLATDEDGEPTGFLFKYSSQPKLKHKPELYQLKDRLSARLLQGHGHEYPWRRTLRRSSGPTPGGL